MYETNWKKMDGSMTEGPLKTIDIDPKQSIATIALREW